MNPMNPMNPMINEAFMVYVMTGDSLIWRHTNNMWGDAKTWYHMIQEEQDSDELDPEVYGVHVDGFVQLFSSRRIGR